MFWLGVVLYNPQGVYMDYDKTFRWFEIKLKGPDLKPKIYHFRCLSWSEWMSAKTRESSVEMDEFILKKCVMNYSKDQEKPELAGTCEMLLTHIKKLSGYDDDFLTMAQASDWMLDPEGGMYEAVASSVLGSVTPTYLRTCDPLDRMKCLILGKMVFENMTGKTVEEAFAANGEELPGMNEALESAERHAGIGSREGVIYAKTGHFDSKRDPLF